MLRLAATLSLLSFAPLAKAQQTCTSTLVALSCGPTLSITFTPVGTAGNHDIEVTCHGLDPNGIGLMIIGQTEINVPLPNCPLLVDFQYGHVINLDATGSHTWSRSWPHWADGYYLFQFGSVTIDGSGNFTVLSTDLMRGECAG